MRWLRRSLGWRLYALGVVQLLLVAGAGVLINFLVNKLAARTDVFAVASRLSSLLGDRAALANELRELGERHGVLLSVYDDTRQLVATNTTPALPLPRFGHDEGRRGGGA